MSLSHSRSTGNVLNIQRKLQQQVSGEWTSTGSNVLRRSHSTSNCVIVSKRGYKPSDRHDPKKLEFLTSLSKKIWHVDGNAPQSDGLFQHKPIDLEKLFTPASDSGEVTPSRHRKMFASSSFYKPSLHPTVEDQVELARRISQSLSDISNQQSKGQSMYVNRKKRSVKWVHEGQGLADGKDEFDVPEKIPSTPQESKFRDENKPILKLVMDPRGQVQDLNSLRKQGFTIEPGSLSPEVAFDLVRDLNAPKGKGAELFAKRRKRSEKWVVDETTVRSSSSSTTTTTEYKSSTAMQQQQLQQSGKAPPLPTYLEESTKRAEVVHKLNEIQERFTQPRLRMVKTPWEAALETGSVDAAFQEMPPLLPSRGFAVSAPPPVDAFESLYNVPQPQPGPTWTSTTTPVTSNTFNFDVPAPAPVQKQTLTFQQRISDTEKEMIYKPRAPRGWNVQQGTKALKPTPAPAAPLAPAPTPAQKLPPPPPPATGGPAHKLAPSKLLYANINNYNTAPRGWSQSLDFYRPVTFDATKIAYST